jgi:hypothetical protein
MATALCIPLPPLPQELLLNLPGLGALRFFRDEVAGFPRLSTMIARMLNAATPVLSPVYTVIKILDTIIAIIDCIKAIPKSLPLNPQPLLNCFRKLLEALGRLIELLPPFSYILLIADLVQVLNTLVIDLAQTVYLMDQEWAKIRNALVRASSDHDPNLLTIGTCAKDNLAKTAAGLWQILDVLSKLLYIFISILQIIASLAPPSLSREIEKWLGTIAEIQTNIENEGNIRDIPDFGTLMAALRDINRVLTYVTTFLYMLCGRSWEIPEFPDLEIAD